MLATLALETGVSFSGRLFGSRTTAGGEVVFHTGMTGYQEILTDPSYAGQIVVFTASHIGNYGIHLGDDESRTIHPRRWWSAITVARRFTAGPTGRWPTSCAPPASPP